ncbi:MAG TPA: RES family NAD+ phosphorylase [Bryobacteraceae bacterium]|nr:RES family NAD+ phosphorylase [Bryobacteraceae bacterium]
MTLVEFEESMFRTHGFNRGPVFFGNSQQHRFDSPDGSYGVLYAGRDAYCAFIETFGRAAGTRVITTAALKAHALAELKARRPLRLIDLTQPGALVRIGADGNLFSGSHAIAQIWSQALHNNPLKADGLLYPSRLDPTRHALALFGDRGFGTTELSRNSWYDTGKMRFLLAEIMEHYQMELIENHFVSRRKPAARVVQQRLID